MNSLVEGLGYVALETTDLEAATAFYTRVGRLRVSGRRPGTVFLRGGEAHHWVRLDEADRNGCSRVAYQLTGDGALAEVKTRLTAQSIEWVEGGDLEKDRVDRWIRFIDPNGMQVELFLNMIRMPLPVWPTGVGMTDLLHV